MSKLLDDWMNQSHTSTYQSKPHEDGVFYLISRKKRTSVFGDPGYIDQWETWNEFKDKEQRDDELNKLRKTTEWVLRADQVTYLNGYIVPGSNPRDRMDV